MLNSSNFFFAELISSQMCYALRVYALLLSKRNWKSINFSILIKETSTKLISKSETYRNIFTLEHRSNHYRIIEMQKEGIKTQFLSTNALDCIQ